jgi:superfamily II DNA or RNA helicase
MQRYLEVVRKGSLPAIWSQGVKLARESAVSRVSVSGGEITLRVRAPGHAVAPTVTLYTEDDEWACDCGGKVDPCAHVAAAAIAAAKGEALADAPPEEEPPRLAYRFARKDRRLALTRVVVRADGREERLTAPLTSSLARGAGPAGFTPTHDDVKVDRLLGVTARDIVPLDRIGAILEALCGADVTLDGAPIKTSGERILPYASVSDGPNGGFVLRVDRSPELTDVAGMGIGLVGGVLRPLGETQTTGEWLEKLPLVRSFAKTEQAELVTSVLPEIAKKLEVDIRTKRLPRRSHDARPRIAMDLTHQGHTLSVLPLLVYGDPPAARVDGDELVTLGKVIPTRRRDDERTLLARLRDELNLVPGRRVDFNGSEAIRFASKLRAWQERIGDAAGAAVFEGRTLVPRLVTDGERVEIVFEHEAAEGEVAGEVKRADAQAVVRAWRDGLELVPLEGGGWAPLPSDWLAKHGHRVADLLAARDEEGKVRPALLPELAALAAALDAPPPLGVEKLAPLLEGFEGIPSAELPDDLRADLREYQRHGIDWLSFLRDAELGAVLADDMGLGKTLQTLAALRGRSLVVCPKSVVYNWQAEIARFRPGLRAAIYHGARRELDRDADVTLTTYAVLRIDLERLAKETWETVVLDEAQAIKNESSRTARAAFELPGRFRVALSGTPVENRLEELWSVMHFANPGLLGGRSDFQERYANPILNGDPAAAARLRSKIRPFVLRRLKRDVLPELPPRTDVVLHVELDDTERSVYDAVRVATRKDLAKKLAAGGNVLAALEALLRLRQAACHPSLVPGQTAEGSSKIERLLEQLEEAAADGHKALVFSQWTSLLDLVEPHLEARGIRFTRLDGSTRDRGSVVAAFQDDAGPPVMLVSLKAGGTGLNLTAADHVFLLDPWWNPAVEDQAADRAHRIGQDRPVMVYRMVAKDTVEERIFALQEKKRAIADVALGNADQAGGVTREELLALLD